MQTCTTIDATREVVGAARRAGKRVGLVPTMGALHQGHLSLVGIAKAKSDFVIVSIFVNPLQFGPAEDLARYPRTFDHDRRMLEREGVDLIFAPTPAEMYPGPTATYVNVEGMSDRLDGASRPGHFRGVTTVVAKLFHIVSPDIAVFGQKDAAQVAVIKRMVLDSNFPLEIAVGLIVRESDGLAMSSRNAYLNAEQRQQALVLSHALREMQQAFDQGERSAGQLIEAGLAVLRKVAAVRVDYVSVVDRDSLEPLSEVRSSAPV